MRDMLRLAHATDAGELLAAGISFACAKLDGAQLARQAAWIETAESCHADAFLERLVARFAAALADGAEGTAEELAGCAGRLRQETLAAILAAVQVHKKEELQAREQGGLVGDG